MTHMRDIALFCEDEFPATICAPDGRHVHISKKCADSPTGLAFTTALVRAAEAEWQEVL